MCSEDIQNAIYSKSDQAPVLDTEGLIAPSSARQWLAARDFLPTLRFEHSLDVVSAADEADDDGEELADDFLFVPEAADGSLFAPNACARGAGEDRGFTIGDKGSERKIADFDKALSELSRMVAPKWRRPNASGNWGIVRAERWRRIRRADLERL